MLVALSGTKKRKRDTRVINLFTNLRISNYRISILQQKVFQPKKHCAKAYLHGKNSYTHIQWMENMNFFKTEYTSCLSKQSRDKMKMI